MAVVDEALFAQRGGCALALPFPLGPDEGRAFAEDLFARFDPAAVVFVEKAGPNRNGVFHSIMGTGRPAEIMANAHFLEEIARRRGVPTVGIADGGNEIGGGEIAEAVSEIQPYGRKCQCPCEGGVGTVVGADVLVMASVSNWGAYGVAAALAGLTENLEVLHDQETELRMLERCVAAGAMDGAYARLIPYVDGTSAGVQTSVITMLHEIVKNGLMSYERGF